ncbi:MAG: C40 family peptidase [Bacteroidales bacterium]|nr:C40 family peptidase [Bacteroidales bacterium]
MKKRLLSLVLLLGALLPAIAQEYGVVNISVCNLRRTADFDAEMVSQALLGTPVHVLSISNNGNPWPQVQTPDNYTGWVHYAAITRMSKKEYHAWNKAAKVVVTALTGVVYQKASKKSATLSDVVAGDRLKLLSTRIGWYKVAFPDGRVGYLDKKTATSEKNWRKQLDQSPEAILATARTMLGFPYLWAGMSPKGMDCSGFVRTTLFMHDIIIPRDCSQMYLKGERITEKELLQPGDLVFFGRYREDGSPRPSHVGFYIGDGRFIHSLGLVQIASFDPSDPLYDAYNTGRYLFGGRVLPYINQEEGLNTTLTNPYYAE